MNIAKLNEDRALEYPDLTKLIYAEQEITNREIVGEGTKLAAALKQLGVQRGDRVIVQTPNCPEVLYAFSAAWRLGAVIVPINYLIGEEETAYIYQDSGARVVISSKLFWAKIQACRKKAPDVAAVILIEDDAPEGTFSYRALTGAAGEETQIVDTNDDDIAALIYTAGTTGKPQGAVHTHGSLYANAYMPEPKSVG